jgi:hypothetical protein
VNPLVFKQTGVLGLQVIEVFAFHDKDDIGPANIRGYDGRRTEGMVSVNRGQWPGC